MSELVFLIPTAAFLIVLVAGGTRIWKNTTVERWLDSFANHVPPND